MEPKRLFQRLGFHDLRMQRGAGIKRIDAAVDPVLIYMNQKLQPQTPGDLIAKRYHFAKFPVGVDMKQRERRLCRKKSLHREVEQHRGIFADRVKQYGVCQLGSGLP